MGSSDDKKWLTILLGSLEHFNFINVDLSEWMNFLGLLFDLFTNIIINKFSNKRFNVALFNTFFNSINHLLSDKFCLGVSGVRCFLNLLTFPVCISDAEAPQDKTVLGLAVYESFDQAAPLSDGVQSLVPMQVKSIELGVAGPSLDICNSQSKLFPKKIRVSFKIT